MRLPGADTGPIKNLVANQGSAIKQHVHDYKFKYIFTQILVESETKSVIKYESNNITFEFLYLVIEKNY